MKLHDLSDFKLMEMINAGCQEAFVTLIHRHQQSLMNFFHRMGAYKGEEEDLTQETFLRLFEYRQRYRPLAKFTTFLYTLARHVWVDRLRKTQDSITGVSLDDISSEDEGLAKTETEIDLQTALNSLPEKLREVVVMSVYQNLRYHEISEILEIPVGTVKSRMYYALKQLRGILSVQETNRQDKE